MVFSPIIWSAPEFEHRPKSMLWYWTSIGVAVALLGVAVLQKNFLFGFFVLTAEILVLVWSSKEPRIIDFSLTEKGISVDGKFHATGEFQNWSLSDHGEHLPSYILFFFKHRLHPLMHIPLPDRNRDEILAALRTILPRVDREESLIDILERFLGF